MGMRKKAARLLVLSMILSSGSLTVFAENKGVVINDDAVVNKSATVDSEVVTNLSLGQQVEVLNVEGDFYKVALEGMDKAFILDDYINLIAADGVVVGDNVIVHKAPNAESEEVGQLSYGTKLVVNGIDGDFYRIDFNGTDAYVHSNFIIGDMIFSVPRLQSVDAGVAGVSFGTVVSKTGANLRSDASTGAGVVMLLPKNAVVDVLDASAGDWIKVNFEGKEGYISSEFLVVQTGVKPEQPEEVIAAISASESSSQADEIIGYAKQFIGTPYSWGGTNLRSGVDCSGFVYAVMRDNGIYLNRSSREQAYNGVSVSKNQLQKGDLVFFDTTGGNNGQISHVGIYMGEGRFIHSSSGKQWGITTNSLSDDYYVRTYVTARRVLN